MPKYAQPVGEQPLLSIRRHRVEIRASPYHNTRSQARLKLPAEASALKVASKQPFPPTEACTERKLCCSNPAQEAAYPAARPRRVVLLCPEPPATGVVAASATSQSQTLIGEARIPAHGEMGCLESVPMLLPTLLLERYEVMPGMSVAYTNGSRGSKLLLSDGCCIDEPRGPATRFTHIIQVVPAETRQQIGTFNTSEPDAKTRILTLSIDMGFNPTTGKPWDRQPHFFRRFTTLKEDQIIAARDFLCLARNDFRHSMHEAHWKASGEYPKGDHSNVLLVAPECCGTGADLMSIIAYYNSYVFNVPTRSIFDDMMGQNEYLAKRWAWFLASWATENLDSLVNRDPGIIEEGGILMRE
ncbi:hypothetical protein BKA70DRAFT_1220828 [Coprinopsis sp. MPI-PUGE-AT-0042]|nr:hypothetical protein BKA70DRAFT_1220828 [Coprinopsis sp. MPI-PUGE-AT-0042]